MLFEFSFPAFFQRMLHLVLFGIFPMILIVFQFLTDCLFLPKSIAPAGGDLSRRIVLLQKGHSDLVGGD